MHSFANAPFIQFCQMVDNYAMIKLTTLFLSKKIYAVKTITIYAQTENALHLKPPYIRNLLQ
jgi:hypothetical protein